LDHKNHNLKAFKKQRAQLKSPARFFVRNPRNRVKFMQLVVSGKDIEELKRFDNMLGALGSEKMMLAEVRAVKHTGNVAYTAVAKHIASETSMGARAVRRMMGKPKLPSFGDISYRIQLDNQNDVPLRLFAARETRKGVTADIPGHSGRKLFEGSFMKGGRFPKRVSIAKMGGNVFEREGAARLGIVKVKSGVTIAKLGMSASSTRVFDSVVKQRLPRRVGHEIHRITGGMMGSPF
jgi:hypothetical protein